MIAKCPKCGFIHIKRQRVTCPHCRCKLKRPTVKELSYYRESMMERMRANVGFLNAIGADEETKLACFMAVFHGRTMTRAQIQEMLRP